MIQPEALKSCLEKNYQLIDLVDLSTVTTSPDQIYQLLQKHYRPVFEQDQKIVFYTSKHISKELLSHIHDACLYVDISASCLLFCACYDCHEDLIKIFGCTDHPASLVAEVESAQLQNNFVWSETLCPLPWMHLASTNQGEIKPCCVNDQILGHGRDSLVRLFNSDAMQNLRRDLRAGKRPSSCNHCWQIESHGGESERQFLLKKNKIQLLSLLDQPKLQSIDLKPGTTCNFKCRICSPYVSSMIASEYLKRQTDAQEISSFKEIMMQSKWLDDEPKIAEEILALAPQLTNLDCYGGEPFLTNSLMRLVIKLSNTGHAEHIEIHFNSNGSIFPDHMIDVFKLFRHVNVCLSIDDIGYRFEYQRGGLWNVIEKNLERWNLLDQSKFNVSVYSTINIQNVLYLDELLDWVVKNNLILHAGYLEEPWWLSISNMTNQAKKLIIEKFQHRQHALIQSVLARISQSQGSDGSVFCKEMQALDRYRSQSFLSTHTEIAMAMGYEQC